MTPPLPWVLVKSLDAERGQAEFDGVVYRADDGRPVTGPMAPLLGPRFTVEQIKRSNWYPELDADEQRVASLVRAYPVNSLLGARVSCTRDGELGERLATLLEERCPGLDLRLNAGLAGTVRKYGFVHTSLDAPVDETTGQPMRLELYGPLVELNGQPPGAWWDNWRARQGMDDYHQVEVREPFTFELKAATYANVLGLGIDVPFYI